MIRLVTYNIQNWKDEKWRYSWNTITETLEELKADVITMNEVNAKRGQLKKLAERLGMYYLFDPAGGRDFGNAILSRTPMKKVLHVTLSRVRSIMLVEVQGLDFLVGVTHLDHEDERQRFKEVDTFLNKFREEGILDKPHVFMGDCNTYRLSDYSEEDWDRIVEERRKNRWREPCEDVVNVLDEHYVDAYTQVKPLSGKKWMTAHTSDLRYRIDYCWLSKNILDRYRVSECRPVQEAMGSDHVPVLTVLKRKKDK